jgi:hypothetical protein
MKECADRLNLHRARIGEAGRRVDISTGCSASPGAPRSRSDDESMPLRIDEEEGR